MLARSVARVFTPRLIIGLLLVIGMAVLIALASRQGLSLDMLKTSRHALLTQITAYPLAYAALYFVFYVFVAAVALPVATLVTLAGGALFGVAEGVLLVSFASTLGATAAMLISRFLLRDWVRRRAGERLKRVDDGLERDGAFYLFSLRLVPAIPFFLVNLVAGLTPVRIGTYWWVSQLGMLPATVVYVNAGTRLGALHSAADVLSPALIGSLLLLAVLPWLARAALALLKRQRLYRRWPRPRRFDRNLVVIGAGASGLVSAYIAATVRAKVTLVEQHAMGGDCLNTGCVPSKALIRSARLVAETRRAQTLGIATGPVQVDFTQVMAHVQQAIKRIAPHDSVERYTQLGVDVRMGQARIVSPWEVEIDGQRLTARAIVIATGAEPCVPPLPGLAEAGYLTSDTVWQLRELPQRLLVLGGGPVGCELSQAFARLGATVTQVELGERVLLREDGEVSAFVRERLEADGVRVLTGHKAVAVESKAGCSELVCEHGGASVRLPFDAILVAVGRKGRLTGYGLETLGIPTSRTNRTIETNDYLETLYPNIYACGDVAGPYQLTHAGAHQAWYATINALFGHIKRFRVNYAVMPEVIFVDPEVARVGLNEREATAAGTFFEATRYDLTHLDRAITEDRAEGFVKVLTVPGKDRVLGVTIVGEHAGELLAEFALAMKHGLGLNKILSTVHAYPTWAEANTYTAGAWKTAHAPERVLNWLARYHRWRRSRRATTTTESA